LSLENNISVAKQKCIKFFIIIFIGDGRSYLLQKRRDF
jgi:hypothetical protein